MKRFKKLVLTGAAGRLGSYLREPLSALCDTLVTSDLADDIGALYPGEVYVRADLADADAILELLAGADMVIHFGAIGDEAPFEDILQANIRGAYNVWEAAYAQGLQRVVYAVIHAVGMYAKNPADRHRGRAPSGVLWPRQMLCGRPGPFVLGQTWA